MKKKNGKMTMKRLAAAALAITMLLTLAACGSQPAAPQETAQPEPTAASEPTMNRDDVPSETLKGIYAALIAPDSDYSENKALYLDFYPELEYSETLEADRITLSRKANGIEGLSDSSIDFVEDGDYLTAVVADDDYTGIARVSEMANAVGAYLGIETELVSGYLNGLGYLDAQSDVFNMTEDEAAGTFTFHLYIGGPWDMKELDQMVLTEDVLETDELNDEYTSQGGNVGKLRYLANGNVNSYTVLFAEFGGLDDVAYQSIINLVSLRKPAGYEAFLADFTELKALETDDYIVDLDPDDDTVAQIMGERNDKLSYMLVRFGSGDYGEAEYEAYVPDSDAFADFYFRVIGGYQKGVTGASLAEARAACDVLDFATGNELWLADTGVLRANMLEGWESLTDEERTAFDANFPELNELLNSCFADWESVRGRFDDAGAADTMEELLADGTAQWSWDELSANTWTLGNSDE